MSYLTHDAEKMTDLHQFGDNDERRQICLFVESVMMIFVGCCSARLRWKKTLACWFSRYFCKNLHARLGGIHCLGICSYPSYDTRGHMPICWKQYVSLEKRPKRLPTICLIQILQDLHASNLYPMHALLVVSNISFPDLLSRCRNSRSSLGAPKISPCRPNS